MELLYTALGLLTGTAILLGLAALRPFNAHGTHTVRFTRICNTLGPVGIIAGCLTGFCAALSGAWSTPLTAVLPWGLPLGNGLLGIDPLSRLFLLPIFGLGAVCAFSGSVAMRHYPPDEHNMGAHWFFFALLILSLALVCTARDSVFFLLSWEVMSVSPFFLIEFNDEDAQVRDASWVYLVAAHLGAVCLLAVFALLWRETGSTAFAAFQIPPAAGAATAVLLLGVLGFGAKAGLAPMHVWLPEAHPAAPSHVSALLSGAMINAGLYGIIRLLDFFTPLSAAPAWWGWFLLFLGLGTGLVGVLKAMAQAGLKRMLAYSSVENMGIMLMGVGVGLVGLHAGNPWITLLGFCATLFHMLNHAAFKGLLFLCAGEVLHATGSVLMAHLGGLQKRIPLVGVAFAIGAASIACLPPFNGFFGEFLLVLSLGNGLQLASTEAVLGLLASLAGLALISGFAAAIFIKAYGITFLGEPRSGASESAHAPDFLALLPLLPPLLACVGLGMGAAWILPQIALALPAQLPPTPTLVNAASGLLGKAALLGLGGILLAGLLWGIRRWLLRGQHAPRRGPTWGCGFQNGTARIQYTSASFSEPTARIFGPAMGLKVHSQRDSGYFPARASLEISAPDRMRAGIFTPLFEGVTRVCDALKIIQHGRVHLYILYMLLTVVALLVWGLQA